MKKIYLILLLCALSFASFATKWTGTLSTATNQVATGNICQGATAVPISRFQIAMASGSGTTSTPTITAMTFSTTGTYVAADITSFSLYYNTTGGTTFVPGSSTLVGTLSTALGTGVHTFPTFGTAVNLQTNGTTFYFFIVANIASGATATHTIQVNPVTAWTNLTVSSAPTESTSGTVTTAGVQSIIASPAAISVSTFSVCAGSTLGLTDATAAGTWATSSSAIASLSTTSGTSTTVRGVASGSATIYYSVGTCSVSATATVGALATSLTPGSASICTGTTTTLSVVPTSATGGTWSSGATGTASVSAAGVVNGVAVGGPVTISYTTPGCSAVTSAITVNAAPNSISGNGVACIGGSTVSLSSTTGGGTWSSVSTAIATVSTGGTVTGLTQGTSVISYVVSGCATTVTTSVTATPTTITGATKLCYSSTTTLTEAKTYGTWSVTATAPTGSSIAAATGVVTGGTVSGIISVNYTNACGSSPAYSVQVGVPTASLPYTQGFESSWINGCNTSDIPSDGYWVNTPSTGNDSWRREDDGGGSNTAVWTAGATGLYSPAGSNAGGASSSHSARFHSYEATSGTSGTLDLLVNMPTGTKQISFDYTNSSTLGAAVSLLISTNNGSTWTTLFTETPPHTSWTTAVVTTTLTATSAILRWSVTSDFGSYDQGVDNVSVVLLNNCTTGPTGITANTSLASNCIAYTPTLTLTGITPATGYTYQWQSSTGGAFSNITGATNATYNPSVSATTNYECSVGCTFGGTAALTSSVTCAVTTSLVSSFPYTQNFDGVTAPTIPCGFTVLDANADGNSWVTYSSGVTGGSAPNQATYEYEPTCSNAADDWLITVPISTTAGNKYRLTFNYGSDFSTEGMSVYWGTSPTVAAMTHLLWSNTAITNSTLASSGNLDFTASSSGTIYYGFHATSAACEFYLFVDDVQVQQIAPCATPTAAPTSLSCSAANGITTSVTCTPPATLPDSFLIVARVATVSGAAPSPVNGTNYAIGASAALGTGCYVIGYGAATTSTTTLLTYATAGLSNNTAYNIYEYSYNDGLSGTCGGPSYYTTPGTTTFTTCVAGPAAPTAGGTITPSSIPLSWTTVGGATGYTLNGYTNSSGTGSPVITSGLLGSGVTTYTFTTGFSSGTTYYFFVTASTASCGAVSSALTVVVPLAPPYFEGFENNSPYEGNVSPDATQGNTVAFSSSTFYYGGEDDYYPIYNSSSFATETAHTGTWQYIFQGRYNTGNADSWLVGPGLYLTAGVTYTYSMYYMSDYLDIGGTTAAYKWGLKAFLSNNGTLPGTSSTAMSGSTVGGTTYPVLIGTAATVTNTNAWNHYTATFTVPVSGTYYYGILGASGASCSYLAIDDIAICQVPTVTASASPNPVSSGCNDVSFNSTTYSGYTYSWTGGVSPTSVQSPTLNATFSSTATATAYSVTISSDPANSCASTAAVTLTVSPSASDAFSYASGAFCTTSSSAPATIAGTSGGGFTVVPSGLSLSSSTGAINPSTSTPGSYVVTYSVAPAGCAAVSTTQNVTINNPVYTNFNYAGSPYCTSAGTLTPTFTGAGVASLFSSTPSGLSLTPASGNITLSTSAANTYTVTNTSTVSGCGTNSTTATIVVNQLVNIGTQPVASSVLTGGTATFSVAATGTGPLVYQWYENNGTTNNALTDGGTSPAYSGSGTAMLTLSNCPNSINSYTYTCTVSGASPCSMATSNNNGIISVASISYTLQPTDASLCPAVGSATAVATFTSGTTSSGTTDVWQENQGSGWNDLADGTVGGITYSGNGTGTLTVTGVTASNNGWQYRRNLNEATSPIISNVANLIVNTPISVTAAPASTGICTSGSGTFGVSVSGTSPVYTWQASTTGVSWTGLTDGGYYSGSSTSVLTVSNPVVGMNGFQYRCSINGSSPCGTVVSTAGTLTVNSPVSISTQPIGLTLCNTGLGSFNVTASGAGLTYAWQVSTDGGTTYTPLTDGGYYSGSATSALSITSPVSGMNGYVYECVVTGTCGSVTSSPAILTVNISPLSVTIAPVSVCLGSAATVTAVPACTPATETLTILGMNFSGGTGTSTAAKTGQVPVGGVWSVTTTTSGGTGDIPWTVYANGTGASGMTPDAYCSPGTSYAGTVTNVTSGETLTTYFASPSFTMPAGTTAATLSFGQYYDYYSGDVDATVQYSTNGGSTWANIVNYQSGAATIGGDGASSGTGFQAESYNILSYIPAGTANAKIRFWYQSVFGFQWCINNVQIVATVTPVYNYAWSGPGTISNTAVIAPAVTPTVTGANVYNLLLTASNFTTCNAVGVVTVTTNPLPASQNVTSAISGYGTTTLTASPASTACAALGSTIGVANTVSGTNYKLYLGAASTATVSGTGSGISFSGPSTTAGTYTVQAVNATTGCTSPMVGSVVVYANPTAGVVSSSSAALCTGGTVTLSQSSAGAAPAGSGSGISQYTWSGPGLSTTTTGSSLTVSPGVASPTAIATSVYTLSVTYPIPGCTAQTVSPSVNVVAVPTLTFAATPSSICSGGTLTVTTTAAGGAGVHTYAWAGPGIVTVTASASAPVSFTPTTAATPGTFTVSSVWSGSGCTTAVQTQTVNVSGSMTVTPSSNSPVCFHSTANLLSSVAGAGGYGYSWIGDAGSGVLSTVTTASLTATPTTSGAHVYTLTVTSPYGCAPVAATTTVTATPQQWLGITSTSWNDATNWACGVVPTATQDVIIPASTPNAATLDVNPGYTNKLTVNSTAVLTLGSGNQLDVANNMANNGTVTGTGVVYLGGSSAQVLSGNGNVSNMTLANSAGATINSTSDTVGITGTLLLNSGTLTTNGNLMLVSNSGGSGSIGQITGGSISGNVIMQQYVPGGRRAYRFIAHPFNASIPLSQIQNYIDITGTGGSANGFTTTTSNAASAYWYNTSVGNSALGNDPGWTAYTSTNGSGSNAFNKNEGIRLYFRGAKGTGLDGSSYVVAPVTYRTWGAVNTGAQSITLVKGTGANEDYNTIGNPYPAITDIGSVINTASTGGLLTGAAFYIWNPYLGTSGQFVTETIGGSYYLGANESFQVRTATNLNTLSFAESNKGTAVTDALMRTASNDYLTLYIYDNSYHPWDLLHINFNDAATDNEDSRYDGAKPPSPASLNFYSLSADNSKLSIDARPFSDGKVIPLGIKSSYLQDFIIKAQNVAVPDNGQVYLHDKYLQTYTQLLQGTEYKFTITKDAASQGDNRFELSMKKAGATVAQTNDGLDVQMVPNPATNVVTITYSAPAKAQTSVRVMDVEGVTVITQELGMQQSGNTQIALDKLASGVYMVEITSGTQKVVHRLVKE